MQLINPAKLKFFPNFFPGLPRKYRNLTEMIWLVAKIFSGEVFDVALSTISILLDITPLLHQTNTSMDYLDMSEIVSNDLCESVSEIEQDNL